MKGKKALMPFYSTSSLFNIFDVAMQNLAAHFVYSISFCGSSILS